MYEEEQEEDEEQEEEEEDDDYDDSILSRSVYYMYSLSPVRLLK